MDYQMDEPDIVQTLMRAAVTELKLAMRDVMQMEQRNVSELGECCDDALFIRFVSRKTNALRMIDSISAYAISLNFDHAEKFDIKCSKPKCNQNEAVVPVAPTGSDASSSAREDDVSSKATVSSSDPPGIQEDGDKASAAYAMQWLTQHAKDQVIPLHHEDTRDYVKDVVQDAPSVKDCPPPDANDSSVDSNAQTSETPALINAQNGPSPIFRYPEQEEIFTCSDEYLVAYVTAVKDPSEFFLTPKFLSPEFKALRDEVNKFDETRGGRDVPIDKSIIKKDLQVMVRDPETCILQRGKILVASCSEVYVYLVDSGNLQSFKVGAIQALPERFGVYPPFAYECSLERSSRREMHSEEIFKFKEIVRLGDEYLIHPKGKKKNKCVVDIMDSKSKRSVVEPFKTKKSPVAQPQRRRVAT